MQNQCNILPIINHMLNASLKFESQALSYMYMHMQDTEIEIYLKWRYIARFVL